VSDVEFVASIKKSEEWKESTPNKVVPQQKITVDNRRTTNNEVLSNINISEKVVPFEKTFDSLVKGNFNVASLEEMKKELFLKFSEKEKEKRVSLGPSTQQAPILANSFRQERTERERTDVHSPLIFEHYENYNDPNKNETVDISFGRKVDTKLDDGEDSMEGVENSDGEIGFSGSDNFELASKSSGCCDACHMEFSKERKCVNFRFSEIDYNVCSICIKANSFKKKKNILEASKCVKKGDYIKCKNEHHNGNTNLKSNEYVLFHEESDGSHSVRDYRQCKSCMCEILLEKYNKLK